MKSVTGVSDPQIRPAIRLMGSDRLKKKRPA